MKTYIPKLKDIQRGWVLVDADGMRLGRLATKVATILRGKHKPIFTPNLDTGDFVVVINADKIELTGRKLEQKTYFSHSMYPGGAHITPLKKLMEEKPEEVIKRAVKGMLPHNILGRQVFRKLKVYSGENHPHKAQQPVKLD